MNLRLNTLQVCGPTGADLDAVQRQLLQAGLPVAAEPLIPAPGVLADLAASQPQTGFVLVYSHPGHALAAALAGAEATDGSIQQVLDQWAAACDELLRFYNRHAERCVLVDFSSVLHTPQAFVEHVAQFCNATPATVADSRPPAAADAAIAASLASVFAVGRKDIQAMYSELASQATLDPAADGVAELEHRSAWHRFLALRDSIAGHDSLLAQLHRTQEALERALERQQASAEPAQKPATEHADAQAKRWQEENELLLLQLHQVQEELEHAMLDGRAALAAVPAADPALLKLLRRSWLEHAPEEFSIDLCTDIAGDNWHDAEPDGRWAGPSPVSTLHLPPLGPGTYSVELFVVDAMHPDILAGAQLLLNGNAVTTEVLFDGSYPALILGGITVPSDTYEAWALQLRFPRTMSPIERGEEDYRQLALRVRWAKFTRLERL